MARSSYTHATNRVDDFYFSALHGDEELFPISDHKYAEELQLQEVLMSSAVFAASPSRPHRPTLLSKTRPTITAGETSSSSPPSREKSLFCQICAETKPPEEMFRTENCPHSFCNDCISKHIAVKVQENIAKVNCPAASCKAALEPPLCRGIIPEEVFQRWGDALCESMVLAARGLYCPYKDCSAFLVDDGGKVVRVSECPGCRRLFCAHCQVPWHAGVECEEFQRLGAHERGKEDLMVIELAKSRSWKRCTRCKFYVEKTDGCLHITCRCGYQFCYGCGLPWGTGAHGGQCTLQRIID